MEFISFTHSRPSTVSPFSVAYFQSYSDTLPIPNENILFTNRIQICLFFNYKFPLPTAPVSFSSFSLSLNIYISYLTQSDGKTS